MTFDDWLRGLITRRGSGALAGLLLVCAALSLFARLGDAYVTRSSEGRCWSVVEVMVTTGDLIVPRNEGEVRLQKPPLFYWLGTCSAWITGAADLFALRLPSALAALLLLCLTGVWASSLGGATLGLGAMALLLSMVQFHTNGRRGDAEMLLAVCCLAALMTYERYCRTRERGALAAFAVLFGCAFLAKATVAFLVIGAAVAVHLFSSRRSGDAPWRPVLAAGLVGTLIGLLWYVAVMVRLPGAAREFFGFLMLPAGVDIGHVKGAEHYGPPWYFLGKLVGVAFPAALFLPVLIWRAVRSGWWAGQPRLRFVATSFAAAFVVFSIVPQKQKHYLLPLLPHLAILLFDALSAAWSASAALRSGIRVGGGLIVVAALVAGGWMAVFLTQVEVPPDHFALALLGLALVLLSFAAAAMLRQRVATFGVCCTVALLLVITVHHAHQEVWISRVEHAADNDLPAPDEDHLLAVAQAKPWLVNVLAIEDALDDIRRRREREGR